MKKFILNLLFCVSIFLTQISFARELSIPTADGCTGKVVYTDTFTPFLKRVNSEDFEKNHQDFPEVPSYFAGILKFKSHTFNVYYNLGPSCDPSFLLENSEKKLFEFSGETVLVKNGILSIRQKFNTCFEITRDLSVKNNTVKQVPKSIYDINKAGILVKKVNLFSDEDLRKKIRSLSKGNQIFMTGYLPSWDFCENKPNRVKLKLNNGETGWIELLPKGPKQETQIDFVRCWGD